ncbi:MAG: DUF2927 domain-containing protein [Pseudomonadota bacterium]
MKAALAIALLTALFSLAPGHGVASDAARYELARGFFLTVFGLEFGGHPDADRVKRYESEVRFFVDDRSGKGRAREALSFVRSLPREIAHFDSRVVTSPADANFRILIVRQRDFARTVRRELFADAVAMNARCLVGVTARGGKIERSVAVIVGDSDRLFRRCLVEETLQGLGPMNDNPELSRSVFNDSSTHAHFTAFDKALMNLLYHPSLSAGMTGADASVALPEAMEDVAKLALN